MFDLQALAFMTDMTRVSAFKMSRDVNQRVYPESGVKTPFHSCSHHGENPARIAEFAKINHYHVSLVPYFLEKLKNTPDGDGNLLDHSMVLYGSPMGDSNVHNHKRLPILLAGKANGALKGNLHIKPRRRNADGERAVDHDAETRGGDRSDRRQHRRHIDLKRRFEGDLLWRYASQSR